LIYGERTLYRRVASRVSQAAGASERGGQRRGRAIGWDGPHLPTAGRRWRRTSARPATEQQERRCGSVAPALPAADSAEAKITLARLHCLEQQLRVRVPRVKPVFVGVCHQPPQRIQRGRCVEVIGQRYEHGPLRCGSLCVAQQPNDITRRTYLLAARNDAACNVSQTASSPACNIPYNMQ
jgi:hypothetical protein